MNSSLAETLRQQLQTGSLQLYAQALVLSKTSQANQDVLQMIQLLVNKEGDRWLELLNRLAHGTSKQPVINFCIADWQLYRPIMEHLDRNSLSDRVLQWMVGRIMEQPSSTIRYSCLLETVGRLIERVFELDIDYKPLLPFLGGGMSNVLSQNMVLRDQKYLKCLINLAKLNAVAQKVIIISNTQGLSQLYLGILDRLVCHNALEESLQMQLVTQLSSISLCYDWFTLHISQIVQRVESALTSYTQHIKTVMATDPQQVLNYQYDISYCKNSQTMPVMAAKLLLSLSRSIDGMLVTVFHTLMDSLDKQQNMEITLLLLSILEPQVRQSGTLIQQMTQYFQQSHRKLFQLRQDEPLFNIRLLCLIQKYNIHLMYDDLKSALKCVLMAMQMPYLVSSRACTTMQCFLEQYDPRFLEPEIYNLSSQVSRLIDVCQHAEYFEMLRVFLKHFDILAQMYCMKLMCKLISRIPQVDNTVGIKILDCLVEMVKKQGIVLDMEDDIDKELLSLQMTKINCDRLYLIGSLLVSHTARIREYSRRLLQSIGTVYHDQHTLTDCHEFIISCCTHCPDSLTPYNIHHLLVDQLKRMEQSQDEEYQKVCYIYQLHVQSTRQVDVVYTPDKSSPQTDGIIISLSPYIQAKMVHPSAIKCEYHRQMWLYYFYQMMPNCMAEMQMYLQEYIRHKNISRDMEIEEDEDYFNIWLNTIKFPILSQNWFQKIKDKVALMPGYEGLKNLLSGKTGTTGSIRKIVKLKQ